MGNRKLASWIDDFITGFSKTAEKEAKVDVSNLPKVIWEDNTFFVNLDENSHTANVMNEYGNVVTTLLDVSSIEDVNAKLNNSVVTAENKLSAEDEAMYNEFAKIADAMEMQMEVTPEQHTETVNEQSEQIRDNNSVEQQTTNVQPMDSDVENAMDEATGSNDMKHIIAKLDECIEKLGSVDMRIKRLEEQIYAHTDPGNIYDNHAQEREVEHYTETMQNGEDNIALEHQFDISRQDERVYMQETKNAPKEDIIIVDEPLPADDTIDDVIDDTVNNGSDDSDDGIAVTDADECLFKQRICPCCGKETLKLAEKTANLQYVVCDECTTKYSVNLENEQIMQLK